MSAAQYHLVCEGFRTDSVNKTQLSLVLKQQLKLNDAQLADMMASRRTILARNLTEAKARELGLKLGRAGLVVRAETAAAHQKISPEEMRHHLMDGGLNHYFAGRYHHPDEETDTTLSLAVMAGVPALFYFVLPLIALLLAIPLLSPLVWLEQPLAALFQAVWVGLLMTPAWLLRPVPRKRSGLKLEADTETLLYSLCDEISHYLDAPSVVAVYLTNRPGIQLHQTPLQWLRGQCELDIGLPFLDSTSLQQTAGEIAFQVGGLAPRRYYWLWGLYRFGHQALRYRFPALGQRVDGWLSPMLEHQRQRQQAMVEALIGRQAELQLQQLRKQCMPLEQQWLQFHEFCQRLDVTPERWRDWLSHPTAVDSQEDTPSLFRINAPAAWALTHAEGYKKALSRDHTQRFSIPARGLWRQFQAYRQANQRLTKEAFPVSALMPPVGSATSGKPNPRVLKRHYRAALANQEAAIRHALGLNKKPPRQELSLLSRAWRDVAGPFWHEEALRHRNLALSKTLYLALTQAEHMELWAKQTLPPGSDSVEVRDRQLLALYHRWLKTIKPLPALPVLAAPGGSARAQLLEGWPQPERATAAEVAERCHYWVNSLQIYWTLVAASLLNSQTDVEEGQVAA